MSNAPNGSNGTKGRQFVVVYSCPCGNRVNLGLEMKPNAPAAVTIPEYRCVACTGFPKMAQSPIAEVEPKRIQPATMIPRLKRA